MEAAALLQPQSLATEGVPAAPSALSVLAGADAAALAAAAAGWRANVEVVVELSPEGVARVCWAAVGEAPTPVPCGLTRAWVARLRAAAPTALARREALEAGRQAVAARLTALRRQLRRAESDHYALYAAARALVALAPPGHPGALLDLLLREAAEVHPHPDACVRLLLLRRALLAGHLVWPDLPAVAERGPGPRPPRASLMRP
jgi:hypothetical protein